MLFISKSEAQFRISTKASFDYGAFTSFDRTAGKLNTSHVNLDAASAARTYEFGMELRWPALLGKPFGFAAELGYRLSQGGLATSVYRDGLSVQHYQIDGAYRSIRAALSPAVTLGTMELTLGPWVDVRTNGTFRERVLLDSPAFYPDATREKLVAQGDTIANQRFQYGIKADIGVPFTAGAFRIIPHAYSTLNLSQVSAAGFKNSVAGGFSISIPIYESAPPPVLASDSDRKSPIAAPPDVHNGYVRFLSNGRPVQDGLPLARSKVRIKQYTLLPFTVSAGAVNQLHLLTREEAKAFDYDKLSHKSPAELRLEAMNVIGFRLRGGTERYSIDGPRPEALSIVQYLDSIWDVKIARADFSDAPATGGITITSADKNVTAPLVTQWLDQSYSVPNVILFAVQDSASSATLRLVSEMRSYTLWHDSTMRQIDTMFDLESNTTWQHILEGMPINRSSSVLASLIETIGKDTIKSFDTLQLKVDPARVKDEHETKQYIFLFPVEHSNSPSEAEGRKLLYDRIKTLRDAGDHMQILLPKAKSSAVLGELNEALDTTNPTYTYGPNLTNEWEVILDEP